ncbi:hypothetical protein CORC01_10779 [Colletotrichum orchidophilum]|uniref:Uncharacterized protein n=1 Tax=Colletotrichum orchidophilum TaxID=1209926 RepID=A0A1G4AXI9_9PEZI|nr:uncharacterized protein CORC01_10779 [Colletotrichum orchidophilum]OHE93880.1 hypothetical protein CORC01_10779 [Colletotrichum orchidophilum]
MAASVVIMKSPTCPGLLRPLTNADLEKSAYIYNHLPRIHEGMRVDDAHVAELLRLIDKNGYHGRLGLHLLHKHDDIADGTIRLESDLSEMPGSWNKATRIDSIDARSIHAVTFRHISPENRLVPYEFAEGPSSLTLGEKDHQFLGEFNEYLRKHSLSDALALEVAPCGAEPQHQEGTTEIEVNGAGTIVLPISMVNNGDFLPTGWLYLNQLEDSTPPKGQTWSKMTNGSHKVFTNNPVGTPAELFAELIQARIIKS